MADLPSPVWPEAPKIGDLSQAGQPPVQTQASTYGVGSAGGKTRAASNVLAAIRGLQQGYAKQMQGKFNQTQDALLLSKAQYDAAVSHVNAYKAAGISNDDPRMKAALTALDDADRAMTQRIGEMQQLLGGGKGGGKGKQAEPGQETNESKLGKVLDKVFHTAENIGRGLIGQPTPLKPVPSGGPPATGITGQPSPVPNPPNVSGATGATSW